MTSEAETLIDPEIDVSGEVNLFPIESDERRTKDRAQILAHDMTPAIVKAREERARIAAQLAQADAKAASAVGEVEHYRFLGGQLKIHEAALATAHNQKRDIEAILAQSSVLAEAYAGDNQTGGKELCKHFILLGAAPAALKALTDYIPELEKRVADTAKLIRDFESKHGIRE